jgi:hypothetical protein
MKRLFLPAFALALLLVAATDVHAQRFQPQNQTGGINCPGDIDSCFHQGDWWITSAVGGSGVVATSCGLESGCWACLAGATPKVRCAYGVSAGACSCHDVPRAGAGPGITDCSAAGSCTVRTTP